MLSWYLWCFWNPSIPFYSLPPSVFHPASFATCFAAIGTWSPFSWAELADLSCHLAWSLACIQADTFLRVILQGEQHYSEVHYVYMGGCQSHERGCNHCEIAHADFTLVKFHCLLHQGILLIGKNIPDVLSQVYKQENPWLLTLAQGDMSYKQVFLWFQCS